MKFLATLLAALYVSVGQAQESWQPDANVLSAARSLQAPAPMQRRSLTVVTPKLSEALLEKIAGSAGGLPIPVRIDFRGSPAKIHAALQRADATIDAELPGSVYASLDESVIRGLGKNQREILRIDVQGSFAAQGATADAGASLPLADEHAGAGVKIGILDFGFAGYEALQAKGVLPVPLARRDFGQDEKTESSHGTACAEIIHRRAPGAQLLIARVASGPNNEAQVMAAAQWLRSQGARIINFSAAGYVSPLDGSAVLDRLVDAQQAQGTDWIVAAGNQAQLHWQGAIRDDDRNGWLDSAAAGTAKSLGDLFAIELSGTQVLDVVLNWSPWTKGAADLDLFVYRVERDGSTQLVASSETFQSLRNERPVEQVRKVLDAGNYLIGIRATRFGQRGTAHLFVTGAAHMSPVIAAGSVGSPGTAHHAITVGAAEASAIADYSGRGPTSDGRSKPEWLAAGSWQLESGAFRGSSAAAPVVAAWAARLLAAKPQSGLQQLMRKAHAPGREAWGIADL